MSVRKSNCSTILVRALMMTLATLSFTCLPICTQQINAQSSSKTSQASPQVVCTQTQAQTKTASPAVLPPGGGCGGGGGGGVSKTTPTITWSNPTAIVYGAALTATQLSATASVAGSFAYSPAAGSVLSAGTQTLSVVFTPTNQTLYYSVSASVPLVISKASAIISWPHPNAITYGTQLSAAQLNATASVAGTFVYSPAAGTVLSAGTKTLSVTFTPTDSTDYYSTSASVSIVVNQATPTIAWSAPQPITSGTPLSSSQLNATANVPGNFSYSPASGAILGVGTQTLSTTFTPTDQADYSTVTSTVSLTVNASGPIVTWPNPAAITYGTPLSAIQLDATANVPGNFSYAPAAATILTVGQQTLSVTFTPSQVGSSAVMLSVVMTVNPAQPTITWAVPASISYGTPLSTTTQLDATASVPGSFAYSPPVGTLLSVGIQSLQVTFTPNDTTNFKQATASVPLTVQQVTPTITIGNIPTSAALGGSFTVTYDYSGNDSPVESVLSSTTSVCTVSGTAVTYVGSGICTLQANANATANYTPAIGVAQSFTVAKSAIALPGPGYISTIAGSGTGGYSGDSGIATNAEVFNPFGVAIDSTGNIYIADSSNNRIRMVAASNGNISTIAGNGTAGFSGDGGLATNAQLRVPTAVAVDSLGNVYISDSGNNRIRMITATTGNISTVVGDGTVGNTGNGGSYSGDGSLATQAALNGPGAIAFDISGNLYFADIFNNRIRRVIAASGIISTVVGNGVAGYSGDGGYATSAELSNPFGVAVDSAGNIYVADTGNKRVRLVTASTGMITTLAGNGNGIDIDGIQATDVELYAPFEVAVDKAGNVYVSDLEKVRVVTASNGIISTVAGNGIAGYSGDGGVATSAELYSPRGIALDSAANIYIADEGNAAIRLVGAGLPPSSKPPTIQEVAGAAMGQVLFIQGADLGAPGTVTFTGSAPVAPLVWTPTTIKVVVPSSALTGPIFVTTNNGVSSNTQDFILMKQYPQISWTPAQLVYGTPLDSAELNASCAVTGSFNYSIATGTVLTVGYNQIQVTFSPTDTVHYLPVSGTYGILVNQATPTITWPQPAPLSSNNALSAQQLNATTSVAGTFIYSPPLGSVPTLNSQTLSVTFVPTDRLDYTTATASVLLQVTGPISNTVVVLAGTGTSGNSGDGGPATSANIQSSSMSRDNQGNLYFSQAYTIRMVQASSGLVSTIAGNGQWGANNAPYQYSGSPDGPSALQTALSQLISSAPDNLGNLYITESTGYRLRKINLASGAIQTIYNYPNNIGNMNIASDTQGNIYGYMEPSCVCLDKLSASNGSITRIAGNGSTGYSPDGTPALQAALSNTLNSFISVDASGNIYFLDNYRIRQLNVSNGTIVTIAGNGIAPPSTVNASIYSMYSGDGGAALGARLFSPNAVSVDAHGNVLIADVILRRVDASTGLITAMTPYPSTTINPTNGTNFQALFGSQLSPLIQDAANNIYASDGPVIIEVGSPHISPIITWPAPTALSSGSAISSLQLNATSNGIPGQFTYTPAAGTILAAGIYVLSAVFTPLDQSTYAVTTSTQSLTVGGTTAPSINWSVPDPITFGTRLSYIQLNASAAIPGYFTYSPSAGSELGVGSQTLTATFTPQDTVEYSPVTTTTQIQVSQATPTLSWPPPRAIRAGSPLTTKQLSATANIPGTYTYSPSVGTVLAVGQTDLMVSFTPSNNNYGSLTASTPLTVLPSEATPVIETVFPDPAIPGTSVTITGYGFGTAMGSNTVSFSGITGTPTSWSDNAIVLSVPTGAVTGNIVINTGAGSSNGYLFMVPKKCP